MLEAMASPDDVPLHDVVITFVDVRHILSSTRDARHALQVLARFPQAQLPDRILDDTARLCDVSRKCSANPHKRSESFVWTCRRARTGTHSYHAPCAQRGLQTV